MSDSDTPIRNRGRMSELEQLEAAAGMMWRNLAELARTEIAAWPADYYFLRRCEAVREAEERDRREWLDGVKRRLGLVTADDLGEVR